MPKIFFIYPPLSSEERYSSALGNSGGQQIPTGIFCLAAFMRSKGYDVKAIDAEGLKLSSQDITAMIEEYQPDFIGISSTTVAFHRAIEVASDIKERFAAPIILGGPHVSADYLHAMSFTVFDYAVYGEGEISLLNLCEALLKGETLNDLLGVIFRLESGESIKNAPQPYIKDLDELPFPAYDLIPDISLYSPRPQNYKKLPVISIITSRGCPGQCTFCDRNVFGNRYRVRSARSVFEEIKMLREVYDVQEIYFNDDTFLINKKRIIELFTLLKEAGIFIYWTCLSRINDVDEEFLKFMKENGCWHISYGIESGDQEVLKTIQKNVSLDKARQIIAACNKLSIRTTGLFMIGHPTETIESINKTIDFAISSNLDDGIASLYTPFPGTTFFDVIEEYGTLDRTDWAKYNYWRPVFVAKGLTQDILLKKQKEFYRRFYFRPRTMIRYLKLFLGRGGFKRFITVVKTLGFFFQK